MTNYPPEFCLYCGTADVVGEAVDIEFPGALIGETEDSERRRVTAGDCEQLRPI